MGKRIAFNAIFLASALLLSACQGKQQAEMRRLGIEQMKNKDYNGAVGSFEKTLELSQGKAGKLELDVLKYRAEAEYQLEDYTAAAHTYDVLLQVDGDRMEYYMCRCLAQAKSGEFDAALNDYQTAAEKIRSAGDSEAEQMLMSILETLGALMTEQSEYQEQALKLYQPALDAGHASGTLYNRMGMLYMDAGDYDGAINMFEQGLNGADDQAKSDLLFNQAVAYEYKSEYQQALQLFERYVSEYGSDEAVQKEINFLRTR